MKSSSSVVLLFIVLLLANKSLARRATRWNKRFGARSKSKSSSSKTGDIARGSWRKGRNAKNDEKGTNIGSLSQCNDQSNCLNFETNKIKKSNEYEYEMCVYWDDENPKCNKKEAISSICNAKRIKSRRNGWNAGISNKICKKVRCGQVAKFGVKDGDGCKSSSSVSTSFNNIKAECVYDGGYCAECNAADCSWKIQAPECYQSLSESLSESKSATKRSKGSHSRSNSESKSKPKATPRPTKWRKTSDSSSESGNKTRRKKRWKRKQEETSSDSAKSSTSSSSSSSPNGSSKSPTKTPTNWKTNKPTIRPSTTHIGEICRYSFFKDKEFDFLILFDNSCGLSFNDCNNLLTGIGKIISNIKGNDPTQSRVAVMQFTAHTPQTLIPFDSSLQNNVSQLIDYISQNGECKHGGHDKTNLVEALNDGQELFDVADDRIDKIIIVSACKDWRSKTICDEIAPNLFDKRIDASIVNLADTSDADNVIIKQESHTYLQCVADNDSHRVCTGCDFDDIIENCLLPQICSPTKWQTPQPTEWATREPTPNPTNKPTAQPTPGPTKWPTYTPTYIPTSKPTKNPTSEPTKFPTHEPTPQPTPNPTKNPTNRPTQSPTKRPTPSPIEDICPYEVRKGFEFDFIVLFDNSCGLTDDDCDDLLEGVGEIISKISDDSNNTRVQTMQINQKGAPDIVVHFNNINLQNDPLKYVQFVRENGECTDGGQGKTDLVAALKDAALYFDLNDDRIDKMIIINACKDKRNKICDEIAPNLSNKGIDSYVVNLLAASDSNNTITKQESNTYLICMADNNINRVCSGKDGEGVSVDEFTDIIQHCLLPEICQPPTPSPTDYPTPEPTPQPTPWPTRWPTNKPTEWPTYAPSNDPTIQPTELPTEWPTDFPTLDPTYNPTIKPSPSPTAFPTEDPTYDPTPNPTENPTEWPTYEPTPNPTPLPTPNPTNWPTQSPTKRPTPSPIRDICPYEFRKGQSFDYVIAYDNSCKMEQNDCDTFLDGIGEIISRIKDNNQNDSRVAVIEFNNDESNMLISFDDLDLQNNAKMLINYMKNNGNCIQGNGNTDVLDAVLEATHEFIDSDRNKKLIIVSGCKDNRNDITDFCNDPTGKTNMIDGNGIDIYVVNLLKVSNQNNTITDTPKAEKYLLCLADNEEDRICIGDELNGVSYEEFDEIIETCLLPQICLPPTPSPTSNPTDQPTPPPTSNPTEWPTWEPSQPPTSSPTKQPTFSPTNDPTPLPTPNPTKLSTSKPTKRPTPRPNPCPTSKPTPKPTTWYAKEPTAQTTVAFGGFEDD